MRVSKPAATTLIVLLLALLGPLGGAEAAKSPVAGGVIHACLKVKGKPALRGALRVVKSARACKKKRGERAIAWNVAGPEGKEGAQGKEGAAGKDGANGLDGLDGLAGPEGPAGQVSQQLLETIQAQTLKIETLEVQVTDLTDEVLDLENTTAGLEKTVTTVEKTANKACQQVNSVTTQTNSLIGAVGGLTLEGVLGGLLKVPALPAVLPTVTC